MIGKKMQEAINEQIKEELGSAYLYLSMAAYFHSKGLDGMAHWMRIQTQEEMVHAMKFFDHIVERDGRAILLALDQPKTSWSSPLEAFQEAYKHEQYITSRINDLVKLANRENDNAAAIMLQWFVTEQVEEEKSAHEMVQKLKLMADAPGGMYMLDSEMGKRVFTPAASEGE